MIQKLLRLLRSGLVCTIAWRLPSSKQMRCCSHSMGTEPGLTGGQQPPAAYVASASQFASAMSHKG